MEEKRLTDAPTEPPVAAELRSLVQRAQAGDTSALLRIRAVLDNHPEVWQYLGDLSGLVERAWTSVISADNPLVIEATTRTIAEMKADLAGDQPTRLELMMVDQVVAQWMEVKYLEAASAEGGGSPLANDSLRLKRLESAQRRYFHAITMLTTVRALAPAGGAPVGTIRLYEPPTQQRA
jgi:hypothetical protein